MSERPRKKLIFAGKRQQAMDYIAEKKLERNEWFIVYWRESVVGIRPDAFELVFVGTWYENKEAMDALEYLQAHPLWKPVIQEALNAAAR